MSFPIVVWILTALAAVAVVLTRLRLSSEDAAGRFSISRALPTAHFVAGVVALVLWIGVLLAPEDSVLGGPLVGILAIAAWWITAITVVFFSVVSFAIFVTLRASETKAHAPEGSPVPAGAK